MTIQDFEDWSTRVYWDYYFTILQDTPESYDGAAKKSVIVNDTETGLNYSNANVDDHSARHEEGGIDEISVADLSGVLLDRQKPQNHASRHEDGGADPITNLGGNVAFPDRSYLRVSRSTVQSLPSGSYHVIAYDTVEFDNRGEWDANNYKFIAENAGLYMVVASVDIQNHSADDFIIIYLSTTGNARKAYCRYTASSTGLFTITISVLMNIVQGDDLFIRVRNWDGSCDTIGDERATYFCVHRVA